MTAPVHLLGPQRPAPNLGEVLATLPGDGRVACITAGWRHDEADQEALVRVVGPRAVPVPLYAWFEAVNQAAPALAAEWHERQKRLRHLKSLYRMRLEKLMDTIVALRARIEEDRPGIEAELDDVIGQVRAVDERFLASSDQVREELLIAEERLAHPHIAACRERARELLHGARAVLIAGGHVGVLHSRLRFFGIADLLRAARAEGTAVVGWSGGAMVLTERIVLFHDDPPWGRREAELLDRGMGIAGGVVVLPHARQRLRLQDSDRVAAMAHRFADAPLVATVENGAWLVASAGSWRNRGQEGTALRLGGRGGLFPLEAPDA